MAAQTGRYAQAEQYKRMRGSLKKLKTVVGLVWRDLQRQLEKLPAAMQDRDSDLLAKTKRLLTQKQKDKNELYSLHAPEAECIAKGKSRQTYEFGVKVPIAITHKEGVVVGMRSMPGNPHDGHTLFEALEQVSILTDCQPKEVFVDLGYRGLDVEPGTKVYQPKLKRNVTQRLRRHIRRRSTIEPAIGHMKTMAACGVTG